MSALRTVLDLPSSNPLPADPFEAADAVVALIEQRSIDLTDHDEAIVKCDGRFFMVIWGFQREGVHKGWIEANNRVDFAFVEVSPFAAGPANDWPVDASDFHPAQDSIDDALSIDFYMDAARLQATGMAAPPSRGFGVMQVVAWGCLVIWLAIAITIVGALAGDGMERCQQTASFDTCFTALNR